MPRTGANYALPLSDVADGGTVESTWANTTFDDIKDALTATVSRDGAGSITGPIKHADGASSAPSITFVKEPKTGLYRPGAGSIGAAMDDLQIVNLESDLSQLRDRAGNLNTVLHDNSANVVEKAVTLHSVDSTWARKTVVSPPVSSGVMTLYLSNSSDFPVGGWFTVNTRDFFIGQAQLQIRGASSNEVIDFRIWLALTSVLNSRRYGESSDFFLYDGGTSVKIIRVTSNYWIVFGSAPSLTTVGI